MACLLRSHGAVCLGEDLEKAFTVSNVLEATARIYLCIRAMGGRYCPISEDDITAMQYFVRHSYGQQSKGNVPADRRGRFVLPERTSAALAGSARASVVDHRVCQEVHQFRQAEVLFVPDADDLHHGRDQEPGGGPDHAAEMDLPGPAAVLVADRQTVEIQRPDPVQDQRIAEAVQIGRCSSADSSPCRQTHSRPFTRRPPLASRAKTQSPTSWK